MGRSKTGKQSVKALAHQKDILELRKEGLSYRAIAERLPISRATAHKAVTKWMAETRVELEEKAEDIVLLELDRLDAMLEGLWTAASSGDGASVDRVLKIMERRAKYLGLDSPEVATLNLQGTVKAGSVGYDLSRLSVDELQEMRKLQAKAEGRAEESKVVDAQLEEVEQSDE